MLSVRVGQIQANPYKSTDVFCSQSHIREHDRSSFLPAATYLESRNALPMMSCCLRVMPHCSVASSKCTITFRLHFPDWMEVKTLCDSPSGALSPRRTSWRRVSKHEIAQALRRHASGDWSDLCPEDRLENEPSLQAGLRLLSAYHTAHGTKFWIVTEADRSVTNVEIHISNLMLSLQKCEVPQRNSAGELSEFPSTQHF